MNGRVERRLFGTRWPLRLPRPSDTWVCYAPVRCRVKREHLNGLRLFCLKAMTRLWPCVMCATFARQLGSQVGFCVSRAVKVFVFVCQWHPLQTSDHDFLNNLGMTRAVSLITREVPVSCWCQYCRSVEVFLCIEDSLRCGHIIPLQSDVWVLVLFRQPTTRSMDTVPRRNRLSAFTHGNVPQTRGPSPCRSKFPFRVGAPL